MNILITAGGTREYIDPVRYISNASTGRMGYALARAALKAGHKVTLITAPTSLRPPKGAKLINIETAAEMFKAVKDNFGKVECLIMSAAVSDYTPAKSSKTKIKKANADLEIKLKPTKDILAWAGKNKKDKLVIGFALEDKNLKANAEAKLKNKKLDMIVANSPAAIAAESSTVYIKTPSTDWLELTNKRKQTTARRIISIITKL
jgi:phosphopantothenoylcysteine synthetase/decarboxylase